MDLTRIQCIRGAVLCGITLALIPTSNVHADFVLDWTADTATPDFSGTSIVHGTTTVPGQQTPFIYERVNNPTDGLNYYHLIVGDPSQDFAQEVYILVQGSAFQGFGNIRINSASGGTGLPTGNASDPLGVAHNKFFTGNATGNPQRVLMHEILNDGDFTMDFSKDVFLEKPTITLDINSADFQTQFVMDGSGIAYNDSTTPAAITNTMQINDPDIPVGSGSFNMATDSQDSIVTAGKYTFTPGVGNGAYGAYTYPNDSFNPDNIHWADYFDSSLANPWSYTTNRP